MSLYFVWKEIESYDSSNRYDYAIFNDLNMAYAYANTLRREDNKQSFVSIPIENVLDVGSVWVHTVNEKQISANIRLVPKEIAEEALKESVGRTYTSAVFSKIYNKVK